MNPFKKKDEITEDTTPKELADIICRKVTEVIKQQLSPELAEPKDGSAEWAKQMLAQGKRVSSPKYQIGDWYLISLVSGGITTDYPYMSMGINSSNMKLADNVFDNIPDGWQIYEPTTNFSKVQVGDWVEFSNGEVREVLLSNTYYGEFRLADGVDKGAKNSDGWIYFKKIGGKHATNATPIRAIRILTKSEALRRTTKHKNLTFMEACDLLDSGVAKEVSRKCYSEAFLVLTEMGYKWMGDYGELYRRISQTDRLTTDWYIKEWGDK